jgi:hypothetical protein
MYSNLEAKSTIAQQTIVGYWILNSNKILSNGKTCSNKVGISRLDPYCTYRNFPQDITYAVLLRKMISINYQNSIKIVLNVFEKMVILLLGPHVKGLYIRTRRMSAYGE